MKEKKQIATLDFFSFERWGFVKDIGLVYLFLIAIEYFLLSAGTYNSLAIHPFWIAVILISSHHGTGPGLLSALVGAALLQMSADSAAQLSSDGDYYQLALEKWGQPILWFIAAIFLGELRHNTLKKFVEARENIALLTLQNQTLTSYCDDLQDLTATLEHKISTQDKENSPYLLGKLQQLKNLSEDDLTTALPPLMETIFGTLQFSLYQKRNHKFIQTVLPTNQNAVRVSSPSNIKTPPHIQTIIKSPAFLSALNKGDSAILGQKALFSGPILKYNPAQKHNNVAGILSIEMLEADRINNETALLFELVCSQLSHSLTLEKNNRILMASSEVTQTSYEKH